MKPLKGFTAAGVLTLAVVAGMAGGALALSAAQGSDPVVPPAVTLHQVADEASAAPTPEPSDAPVTVEASATEEDAVAAPSTSKSTADRAEEAADRAAAQAAAAEAAAARAKDAADRAAKPTPPPASVDPVVQTGANEPVVKSVDGTPYKAPAPAVVPPPAAPKPAAPVSAPQPIVTGPQG